MKDFIETLDSFGLIQSVCAPTHERSHILDLVLSSGLEIIDLTVDDVLISDHFPVLFSIPCHDSTGSYHASARCTRFITSSTAALFTKMFNEHAPLYPTSANTNDMLHSFQSSHLDILDSVPRPPNQAL